MRKLNLGDIVTFEIVTYFGNHLERNCEIVEVSLIRNIYNNMISNYRLKLNNATYIWTVNETISLDKKATRNRKLNLILIG